MISLIIAILLVLMLMTFFLFLCSKGIWAILLSQIEINKKIGKIRKILREEEIKVILCKENEEI